MLGSLSENLGDRSVHPLDDHRMRRSSLMVDLMTNRTTSF
jgi:hypothetical protein